MSIHTSFVIKLPALAACAVAAWSAAAQAADNTRYISIAGKNTNPCTLAQPCRTLQRGINITPAGGELRVLDSGDYGANGNIRKSLTITGNGNTIFVANGIAINNADAVVALRGLTLDGQGTIPIGIDINAAGAVHIERCVIRNFGNGMLVSANDAAVFILDSIVRSNAGFGLHVSSGNARVTIDDSRFEDNGGTGVVIIGTSSHAAISRATLAGNFHGIVVSETASVSVVSTSAVHNINRGFRVGLNSLLTVESSVAHGNGLSGLDVLTGGTARISNSTFTGNGTGISNSGVVETRGNNTVRGNTTDLSGNALTPIGGI